MPKCQLLENVGACQNVSYLKMSALKKYSKFKSKCAYINHSKSYYTCAYINVSAYKSACAYNLTIWARRALHSALLLSQAEVLVLILVLSF
jgi:hypothetical protein